MGAIRLFLSYAVVLEHFNQQVLGSYHIDFNPLWSASINGGRAVLLFYVVSGFLISYVLHEKYGTDRAGTLAFYRSRFLRIYPLWWAILAFAVLFDLWRHSSDPLPSNPLPAIALYGLDWIIPLWKFPAFDWSVVPYRVAIGWTLGAEVTFYLMAPFVLRSNRLAIGLLLGSAAIRTIILLFVSRASPGYVNLTLFSFRRRCSSSCSVISVRSFAGIDRLGSSAPLVCCAPRWRSRTTPLIRSPSMIGSRNFHRSALRSRYREFLPPPRMCVYSTSWGISPIRSI